MKICFINNLYKPYSKGGAEAVIENIMGGLVLLNHQVILITLGRKDEIEELDPWANLGASNIKIYRIKVFNIFSFLDIDKKNNIFLKLIWWVFNIFNISSYIKIKKILKQENPDIVNLHNLTGIGFLLFRLIKRLNIKSILTIHDIQLAYPSGRLIYKHENDFINRNILRILYEKLIRFLVNSPDIIISPSKWLLNFYDKRNFFKNSEKYVLVNPVDSIDPVKSRTNRDHGAQFLYVGNIEEYKGIFLLLNIFKDLDYELHIVGDGKDFNKAKKFESNNIFFHGRLNKKELEKIYSNSDILIFPSLTYENCPTVILEAFSFGLPVIASKIGGVPELVDEEYLFEQGNENELNNIIKNININNINIIKNNCLKKAEEYNLDKYLDEYIKICFN